MLPQPRTHGYLSAPEAQGEIVERSPVKEKGFAPCARAVPKPAPRLCLPLAFHERIEEAERSG